MTGGDGGDKPVFSGLLAKNDKLGFEGWKMNYKYVGVNENGARVGETHHRAKLTDHDIDLIRQLHDDGLGYKTIADKFEVGKSTIRDIVKCTRRGQTPAKWVRVATEEPLPSKPKEILKPRVTGMMHGKVKQVRRGIGKQIPITGGREPTVSKAKMFRFLSIIAEHPKHSVTVKSLTARYRIKYSDCAKHLNTHIVLKLALRSGFVRMQKFTRSFDYSVTTGKPHRVAKEWFITEKGLLWLDS